MTSNHNPVSRFLRPRFFIVITGLLFSATMFRLAAQETIIDQEMSPDKLPVESVTLYGNMAEVLRSGSVDLHTGKNRISIPDLPQKLLDATVTVTIDAKDPELRKLEIMEVHKKIYQSEEAKKAETDLKSAEAELNNLTLEFRSLVEESRFLEQLQFLDKGQDSTEKKNPPRLDLEYWKASLFFFHRSYQKNQADLNAILPKIDTARENFYIALTVAERYKSGIQTQNKTIALEIFSPAASQARIFLSYRIPDAGWFPVYLAKINSLSGTKAHSEIEYYAFVKNETGENWTNARLNFSTSDPYESVNFPQLTSRMIKYRDRESEKSSMKKSRRPSSGAYGKSATMKEDMEEGLQATPAEAEAMDDRDIQADKIVRQHVPQSSIQQQNQIASRTNESKRMYSKNMSEIQDERARSKSRKSEENVSRLRSSASNMNYYYDAARYQEAMQTSDEIIETYNNLPPSYQKHFAHDVAHARQVRENSLRMSQSQDLTSRLVMPHESSRGFDYRFVCPVKETIPSQKVFYKVFLKKIPSDVSLFHESVPYRSSFAFLTGETSNPQKLPILAGPAQIFYDNTFMGIVSMGTISQGETYRFHLGVDPNVKIKRDFSHYRKESGIFSGSYTKQEKVKISVHNQKGQSIDLRLYERIPVAENDKVEVKNVNTGLSFYSKDKNGILQYRLSISKNQKLEWEFSWEVEHSKDHEIISREAYYGGI